jgi:hypothetical protein
MMVPTSRGGVGVSRQHDTPLSLRPILRVLLAAWQHRPVPWASVENGVSLNARKAHIYTCNAVAEKIGGKLNAALFGGFIESRLKV